MKLSNLWLKFAEEDLLLAEYSLKEGIYNQVCFHSQQGVEKLLKGYVKEIKKNIPKTHFLSDLLNICIKHDSSFSRLKESCLVLDKYYIPTRYPDALPGMLSNGIPNEDDAKIAVEVLKDIKDFVLDRLG